MVGDEGLGQSVPVLSGVVDTVEPGAVAVGLEPRQVGGELNLDGCAKTVRCDQ